MRNSVRILFGLVLVSTVALFAGCGKKERAQAQAQPDVAAATEGEVVGPWRMGLTLSPNHPSMTKPVTFTLHIADEHGKPVNDAQVNGALSMKLMDMGVTKLTFAAKGNGDYVAGAKSLDMSGPWSVAIEAKQGKVHVNHSFDVVVYD